jgi:hypothetical protein
MMRLFRNTLAGYLAAGLLFFGVAQTSQAGPVLVINGASGTSEPGTTALITANLSALLTGAGNTVTVMDGIPSAAVLGTFAQVWDIRFSNNLALSAADRAEYVAYLAAGHSMFVMGENSAFATRNASVIALVALAGGGSLTFLDPFHDTQTVNPPFTGPNPVSSVTYLAAGNVTTPGTGQFITTFGPGGGAGVAFAEGTLSGAPAGRLSVIFDVNFMQGNVGVDQQNLLKNLIGFVGGQAVPEPATVTLAAIGGVALCGLAWRRRCKAKAA